MPDSEDSIILHNLIGQGTDFTALPWQAFRDGIEIYPIYENQRGCSAALLRYAPGASIPSHTHTGYEHILILEGEQADERGAYSQGTLMISPPGSSHSIVSRAGCVVLAIWERPVSFL